MVSAKSYVIEIVKLTTFDKQAKRLLSGDGLWGLMTYLAGNPTAGVVIPDTGGVRKIRWGMEGRGKRAGARVIYFYHDLNMPLYLLAIYAKNERIDVTAKEKKEFKKLVEMLVSRHGELTWDNVVRVQIGGDPAA
jgi:hypothetical protein